MKDTIFIEMTRDKGKLLKGIADITALVEVARITNCIDLVQKYKLVINNANLNAAKELRLTGVNKY